MLSNLLENKTTYALHSRTMLFHNLSSPLLKDIEKCIFLNMFEKTIYELWQFQLAEKIAI